MHAFSRAPELPASPRLEVAEEAVEDGYGGGELAGEGGGGERVVVAVFQDGDEDKRASVRGCAEGGAFGPDGLEGVPGGFDGGVEVEVGGFFEGGEARVEVC